MLTVKMQAEKYQKWSVEKTLNTGTQRQRSRWMLISASLQLIQGTLSAHAETRQNKTYLQVMFGHRVAACMQHQVLLFHTQLAELLEDMSPEALDTFQASARMRDAVVVWQQALIYRSRLLSFFPHCQTVSNASVPALDINAETLGPQS